MEFRHVWPLVVSCEAYWDAPPGIPDRNQYTSATFRCAAMYIVIYGLRRYRP
jgi:hypothetical protein